MSEFDDFDDDDTALRARLRAGAEPDDAGFSQRVMAALPRSVGPRQRRRARWVRRAQWAAITVAACAIAGLMSGAGAAADAPRMLAVLALSGLLVFWVVPSRWSLGWRP